VQEAFSRLCREDPASLNGRLEAWLYTVCRNTALDEQRKQKRVVRLVDAAAETIEGGVPSPAETAHRGQTVSRLAALVETLPPREQEVIRLKFQEGLRYRQIAEVMELSVGNVGYLIHTAVNRLREQMGEE
jgi:RNA polymerase sigma-70 factor (ECF subfamily)